MVLGGRQDSRVDAVAGVAEVISWVALLAAVPFALLFLVLWLVRGSWRTATAVVVDGEVRRFGESGDFHSAEGAEGIEDADSLEIFYRTGRPDIYYAERVAHDESAYRFLALLLAAIGVIALIVSMIGSLL